MAKTESKAAPAKSEKKDKFVPHNPAVTNFEGASFQKKGGATVCVGLKQPMGLQLRVFKQEETTELTPAGGYRTIKQAVQIGDSVMLFGVNTKARGVNVIPPLVVAGYAITPNVPKEFMDLWWEQNKDSDLVRSGMIYVEGNRDAAHSEAIDRADLVSGLHPLNPDPKKEIRIPKSNNPNVSSIEVAEGPSAA